MIHLNLSDEQQELLVNLLEICLSDLRMEIAGTDRIDFKQSLQDRKHLLVEVLNALKQAEAPTH